MHWLIYYSIFSYLIVIGVLIEDIGRDNRKVEPLDIVLVITAPLILPMIIGHSISNNSHK